MADDKGNLSGPGLEDSGWNEDGDLIDKDVSEREVTPEEMDALAESGDRDPLLRSGNDGVGKSRKGEEEAERLRAGDESQGSE